jgi:hypothetical protein
MKIPIKASAVRRLSEVRMRQASGTFIAGRFGSCCKNGEEARGTSQALRRARSVGLCSLVTRSLPVIGKARIAQTGPDGKNTPAPHVLHERDLTQTSYTVSLCINTIVSCGPIFGID